MKKILFYTTVAILFCGCSLESSDNKFSDDVKILEVFEDLVVLKNGGSMVAVSPSAHGQIFSISADGYEGKSLSYFNRNLIESTEAPYPLSNLGGANRLMLGPQFGKYSVFFEPGAEQIASNIKISPALDKADFKVISQTPTQIICAGEMQIRNANAYVFDTYMERTIKVLSAEEVSQTLDITLPVAIDYVCYSTSTRFSNIGAEQWSRENGLLSIWDLSCMLPADDNVVLIPLAAGDAEITNYFSHIDVARLRVKDGFAFYKADAKYMNKIGTFPEFSTPIFGAYSPSLKQLVITKYTLDKDGVYVNSEENNPHPYRGDVINVFNGEVNAEKGRNWNFYEMETSSPALELMPGEEIQHKHTVFVFVGEEKDLDSIAEKTLGLSLKEINQAFD